MICTRCEGTGFIDLEQLPESVLEQFDEQEVDWLLNWLIKMASKNLAQLAKQASRITELEGQRDRALANLEYEYKQRLKYAETQFKQLEALNRVLLETIVKYQSAQGPPQIVIKQPVVDG